MSSTLTIRLPRRHRAALKRRAAALRKTESDVVRELIEKHTARGFNFETVRSLAGIVHFTAAAHRPTAGWREHLRQANWRK